MRIFFPFFVVLGCGTEITTVASSCDVEIHSPQILRVAGSDLLQVEGSPLTTHFDTAAYIGGSRATVLEVNRDSCEECDDCRLSAECNICEDCDECDALCDATCTETATLVIPTLSPGPVSVQIYNSYGQSNSLDLDFIRTSISEAKQPLDTAADSGLTKDSGGSDSAQAFDSGSDTAEVEGTEDSASTQ